MFSLMAVPVDMCATPSYNVRHPKNPIWQLGNRKQLNIHLLSRYLSNSKEYDYVYMRGHSNEHVSNTIQQRPTPEKSNMAAKNTEVISFWPPYWIFWCRTLSDDVAHMSTEMAMCENIYLAFEIKKNLDQKRKYNYFRFPAAILDFCVSALSGVVGWHCNRCHWSCCTAP